MRWSHHAAIVLVAITALCGCAARPPELTPDTVARLPAQVELAQVPFFPQEQYQCGPAALATVLQSAGVAVLPQELTPEVYLPGRKGSLQMELMAALRVRDRVPYQLPGNLPALLEQLAEGRAVLVMQNLGWKTAPVWHFAVLIGYDLNARTLILRSGTTQRLVVDAGRFMTTWDRAQRWALVALEPDQLPPNLDLDRYLAAAASLEAVGRLDAAAQAYARARERWPQSVWPPLGLANVSYKKGVLQAAEANYLAALALDPTNVVAHNNLAEILVDRGCVERAREHADRAAALARGTSLELAVNSTQQRVARAPAAAADSNRTCTTP
jgi:tetratricopeptide (TPR) repeat protein